ncbi:MAG TPA: phosphoribosyltransferase family protein [Hyphomicrobiaceae bacterium]|nr:phosphoribosyltransferase family protein [Hyphomicrobiaceae bacterium]
MRRGVIFADRAEAGRLLAARLQELKLASPVVFALPRGGVPIGAEVARAMAAPLDVAFARKIGAPQQPELAVGAVAGAPGAPELVLNSALIAALDLSEEFIAQSVARELASIERQRAQYRAVRPAIDMANSTAIVVDDGVATGMTTTAALRHLRARQPRRLIAAAPVAAAEAAALLQTEADEVVLISAPRRFGSVGGFYRSFTQVSEAEAMALLSAANGKDVTV